MARRQGFRNAYENAFEALLREAGLLYIAINERKRPLYKGEPIKNFDFIVSSFGGKYLVDVKGKKLDYAKRQSVHFENWISPGDLTGLKEWTMHFSAFVPLIVFPYRMSPARVRQVKEDPASMPLLDLFRVGRSHFNILGIEATHYYNHSRRRAKVFDAVNIPSAAFLRLARPITDYLPELSRFRELHKSVG